MSFLQMPIIGRACAPVGFGDIHFGDTGIMLDHLQRAVPKQGLEREEIAAASQIGNGKGMAKQMGVAFFDVDFPTQVGEQFAQCRFVQFAPCSLREEGCTGIATVLSLNQITPQGTSRGFTQEDDASLATFRSAISAVLDLHSTRFGFDIADG